jgi:hypothetical protein
MTMLQLTNQVEHLVEVISDLKTAVGEANGRLHGIEMRLLEERAISNAFIYDKIAELQKKMLANGGSAGEPVSSTYTGPPNV